MSLLEGKKRQWKRRLTGAVYVEIVICALTIFLFSSQPGVRSFGLSRRIILWFYKTFAPDFVYYDISLPFNVYVLEPAMRKAAHFLEFAVLGQCLRSLAQIHLKKRRLLWPALIGLVCSAADEIHQLFVPNRTSTWTDVCIDFAGCCAGIALAVLLIRHVKKHLAERYGKEETQ